MTARLSAIEEKNGVIHLHVRVQPKASRNEVRGEVEGRLRVALTAPPIEGAANKALIAFIAKDLGVPKRAVTLLSGEHSRNKALALEGVSLDEVCACWRMSPL